MIGPHILVYPYFKYNLKLLFVDPKLLQGNYTLSISLFLLL